MTINTEELYTIISILYNVKDLPLLIMGDIGIGKSELIANFALEKGVPFEVKIASHLQDVDVGGMPYIDKDTKDMHYSIPRYIKNLNTSDRGIWFIDEITTAPFTVQSMLLEAVRTGKFEEFEIPQNTFRIMAGNYNNVSGTHQLSSAVINRCCVVYLEADPEVYARGITSGWAFGEPGIITTGDEYLKNMVKYTSIVADFIKKNPKYFYVGTKEVIDEKDVATETSRSWTKVIDVLATADKNNEKLLKVMVSGLIGTEAMEVFFKYMKSSKTFHIDLLQYAEQYNQFKFPNPKKHDEVSWIASNIMFLFKKDPVRFKNLMTRIMNLLHNKDKLYGDYLSYDGIEMMCLRQVVKILFSSKNDLTTSDKSKILYELSQKIDDWNELESIAVTIKQQ